MTDHFSPIWVRLTLFSSPLMILEKRIKSIERSSKLNVSNLIAGIMLQNNSISKESIDKQRSLMSQTAVPKILQKGTNFLVFM